MSNLISPKYVIFNCNVCNRQTQIPLDGRRPDPYHCNITSKCKGNLIRQGERFTKEFLLTAPVTGLVDYIPRGTKIPEANMVEKDDVYSISTSNEVGVLVLAGLKSKISANGANRQFFVQDQNSQDFIIEQRANTETLPVSSSITFVLYEIPQVLLEAKKYLYYRQNFIPYILGSDDSVTHINLRFNADNDITIYVNGIKLDSDKFDRSVDNKITFTPMITDSNNVVEIIVSNKTNVVITENSTNLVRLVFNPLQESISDDLEIRSNNAWGDCAGAVVNETDYILLYCTDNEKLLPSKQYSIAWVEASSPTETKRLNAEQQFILLGHKPFLFDDKETYAYIKVSNLVNTTNFLSYDVFYQGGDRELTVFKEAITQIYNPITTILPISVTQGTMVNLEYESKNQIFIGTENLKRSFVIGPR